MAVREITSGEGERIAKYLELDVDQLFSLIPVYSADIRMYAPAAQRAAGQSWFNGIRADLERKLCGEWEVCNRIDSLDRKDTTTLVIAVADAVCTVALGSVPAILIASIIVKIGLRSFCDCHEEESS